MKKVLLVSSSKRFLNRSTNLLKNQGVELFTSSSGLEALKLHEELNFDLILSDFELEDMDGCSLCAEIHTTHNPTPVPVILICNDKIDAIAKVKQSDAIAILLQPINPIHLLNTIGSFLDMQLVKNKRAVFNAKVLCQTEHLEFLCDFHDISIRGIILATEHHLALRSRITCKFHLPGVCPMEQEGEVMRGFSLHNGKRLYGVKFIDLPETNLRAIEAYVATNSNAGVKQKAQSPIEKSKIYQQD